MDSYILILVLAILFVSSFVRSAFGFGDALIAMPLLVFLIDIKIATPIVALAAILIATIILIEEFRRFDLKRHLPLILYSVAGIPFGLFYLRHAGESLVKIVLGVVLFIFSLYNILKPGMLNLKSNKSKPVFGFLGGLLGGAYNTNGPPIIIYGMLRGWEPAEFRTILQGIFFPVNLTIIIGHGLGGFWTSEVIETFLYALPVILVAIFAGRFVNKRISIQSFVRLIYFMLLAISIVLLVSGAGPLIEI